MRQFEYKTLQFTTTGFSGGKLDQDDFQQSLNREGLQGWELVSCFPTTQGYGSTRQIFAVFKREKGTA